MNTKFNERDNLRTGNSPPASRPQVNPHPDAIVYLVQEPTIPKQGGKVIDTTPLLRWGEVRVIMERGQYASFRPTQAHEQVYERLKTFNPDRDYVAIAGGDTLAQILVGAALSELGHIYFNYLRFDRAQRPDGTRDPSRGAYVNIVVPLSTKAAIAPRG